MRKPQREIFRTDDIDRVDHIMTSAFALDPTFVWTTPVDTPERHRWLYGFFRTWHRFIRQHGGFALMDDSRTCAMVTEAHQDVPPGEKEAATFYEEMKEATGPAGERTIALMRLLEDEKPTGLPKHFHGCLAGALPDGYARGAITDMLNWHRGYMDALGMEMYLEASSKAAMHRWARGGFVRVGKPIRMPDSEVEVYPMLTHRQPGTAALLGVG